MRNALVLSAICRQTPSAGVLTADGVVVPSIMVPPLMERQHSLEAPYHVTCAIIQRYLRLPSSLDSSALRALSGRRCGNQGN